MAACWSDLATDLLVDVTGLLTLMDQLRFGSVCRHWRFVAKHKARPPVPQLPWLVLGEDKKTKKRNFLNLSEQRHYSVDIPELYGQFVCGSSHGWLVTVDIKINGRVVNPLTRECYELPLFPPFSIKHNITTYTDEPAYDSAGKEITFTFKEAQRALVLKAVLSHDPRENPDFYVVFLFGGTNRLAIWKAGDKDWTVLNYPCRAMADIFYFEGYLYAVATGGNEVYVIDVGRSNCVVRRINNQDKDCMLNWKYFVVLDGKLMLVTRYQNHETHSTDDFLVRVLDLMGMKWREIDNINGHALFVGNNSPIIVNPSGCCVGNGIYFTDVAPSHYWFFHGHDVGVYDMVEGAITLSSRDGDDRDDVMLPPDAALTWFTPSP
ncbi:hypothetical protein LUZ60_008744 [Juncus effusus]|nr:hypothetical protein LUZ60_008744 [Juncus effusus]